MEIIWYSEIENKEVRRVNFEFNFEIKDFNAKFRVFLTKTMHSETPTEEFTYPDTVIITV